MRRQELTGNGKDKDNDNDIYYQRDLGSLRYLLWFWQLRIRIHDNHCDVYICSEAFVPGQGIICVCCQQILKTQSLKICRRLTGHCATAMHKSNLESMKNQARHRNGWSWSHSSGSVWCSSLSFCWSGHIFSSLCCLDNLFSTKFIESLKKSQQKVISDANILAAKHMATNWGYRWAFLSPSIDDCATRAMILSLNITLANFKGSPA